MANGPAEQISKLREQMIDVAIGAIMVRLREINFPIANEQKFEEQLADLLRFA
jgi:hypothetical protein